MVKKWFMVYVAQVESKIKKIKLVAIMRTINYKP